MAIVYKTPLYIINRIWSLVGWMNNLLCTYIAENCITCVNNQWEVDICCTCKLILGIDTSDWISWHVKRIQVGLLGPATVDVRVIYCRLKKVWYYSNEISISLARLRDHDFYDGKYIIIYETDILYLWPHKLLFCSTFS